MDDNRVSLSAESEHYKELATLLGLKRSEEDEKAVLAIIHDTGLTVEEKISRIRALDDRPVHSNSDLLFLKNENGSGKKKSRGRQPVKKPVSSAVHPEEEVRLAIPETPQLRAENRISLIRSIPRQGAMKFLFREIPHIKQFARSTGLLRCRVFPPSVKMTGGIESFFHKQIEPLASALLGPLQYIEENGWLHLTKSHYNLIREFQLLCRRMVQLGTEKGRTGEKNRLIRLRRLEDQFFACHYHISYPETIVASIQDVLANSGEYLEKAEEFARMARRILSYNDRGPSLYGILVAMYIVDSRRMVELDDLLNKRGGAIISSNAFNCSREVRETINRYIDQKVRAMDVLYKQRMQLIRFKSYMHFSTEEDPDIFFLERLVDISKKPEDFYKVIDPANMLQSAAVLGEYLDALSYAFLKEPVPVADSELPVQIFNRETFTQRLSDLNHIADELIRFAAGSRHIMISRERMSGAAERMINSATASNSEMEAMEKIMKLSECLFKTGEDLVRVVTRARTGEAPDDTLASMRPDNHYLTRADSIITLSGFLEGETIAGAVQLMIGVYYTAAWFFHNRKITLLFEKQRQVEQELHSLYGLMEQIASEEQILKIRKLFPMV